jgi:hypothetical protein
MQLPEVNPSRDKLKSALLTVFLTVTMVYGLTMIILAI